MLVVIIQRISKRKSPFLSDRSHFHHKLLDKGLTHKESVIVIYFITQWCVTASILFTDFDFKYLLFLLSTLLLIFSYFNSNKIIAKTKINK